MGEIALSSYSETFLSSTIYSKQGAVTRQAGSGREISGRRIDRLRTEGIDALAQTQIVAGGNRLRKD